MGWLWSSSPAPSPTSAAVPDESPAPVNGIGLSDEQKTRIFGQLPTSSPSKGSNDHGLPPDHTPAHADAELDAFLKALDSPATGAETSTVQQADLPNYSTKHERILPDGRLNIAPDALYPRSMSCRDAFDQAFYCQSLGGKFNDVYRYGAVKECSDHWAAFWFCMRIRTLPGPDKEEQIAQFYRTRDEKRKKQWGSSEDVWDLRERALERAFWRDPDAEEGEFEPAVKQ